MTSRYASHRIFRTAAYGLLFLAMVIWQTAAFADEKEHFSGPRFRIDLLGGVQVDPFLGGALTSFQVELFPDLYFGPLLEIGFDQDTYLGNLALGTTYDLVLGGEDDHEFKLKFLAGAGWQYRRVSRVDLFDFVALMGPFFAYGVGSGFELQSGVLIHATTDRTDNVYYSLLAGLSYTFPN